MAIVYLEPDDLSAAQQARVLRVLNLAIDAAALAAAIEMPGEPDIGIKLAERLLRARTAANGQFTTLAQINAVTGIGPERFTDLCVAILGLQREQLAKLGSVAGQRLASATATAYVGTQLQLQIDVEPQPAWLGQTLRLILRATQDGAPLVNRSITLETSLGVLAHSFGYAQQSGSALVVRTGTDGCARLTLDYQPYEPLTQDQDNALQMALEGLDTSADTPEQIRVAFNQLAAEYDDERNIYLRRALDIYSKHGQQFWQRMNATNAEFEWPHETAVLRAYLHGGALGQNQSQHQSQSVLATAVTITRWTNWIPAWFNFLHDWLANRAALPTRLAAIKRKGLRGYALVDNLIGEAHSFVASQKGFAAEMVSQHLVSDSVKRFLSTELEDVPDDTKRMLFPNLELAAEQIRAGNRGSLELVANTRGALKADIADIGQIDAGMLAEIRGIREEVNMRAIGIQEQVDVFSRERAQFEVDYGGFVRDHAQFNDLYGRFTADFGTFSDRYAGFNAEIATFGTQYRDFTGRYATFDGQYNTFTTQYSTFNRDFSAFNTNYNSFSANYTTFNTNYSRFSTDYSKFNTDYTDFNRNRTVIVRDLATVTASVNTLQTQNAQLSTQVNSMNTQVSTMNSGLNQVRTDITGINQKLRTRGPG